VLVILLLGLVILISCTDNARARKFGGSENIELKENQILVTTSWKGDQLWILVKDTVTDKFIYQEKSSWGIIEGQIIFTTKK